MVSDEDKENDVAEDDEVLDESISSLLLDRWVAISQATHKVVRRHESDGSWYWAVAGRSSEIPETQRGFASFTLALRDAVKDSLTEAAERFDDDDFEEDEDDDD